MLKEDDLTGCLLFFVDWAINATAPSAQKQVGNSLRASAALIDLSQLYIQILAYMLKEDDLTGCLLFFVDWAINATAPSAQKQVGNSLRASAALIDLSQLYIQILAYMLKEDDLTGCLLFFVDWAINATAPSAQKQVGNSLRASAALIAEKSDTLIEFQIVRARWLAMHKF